MLQCELIQEDVTMHIKNKCKIKNFTFHSISMGISMFLTEDKKNPSVLSSVQFLDTIHLSMPKCLNSIKRH